MRGISVVDQMGPFVVHPCAVKRKPLYLLLSVTLNKMLNKFAILQVDIFFSYQEYSESRFLTVRNHADFLWLTYQLLAVRVKALCENKITLPAGRFEPVTFCS